MNGHRSRVFSAAYHPTPALLSQFVSGGWDNTSVLCLCLCFAIKYSYNVHEYRSHKFKLYCTVLHIRTLPVHPPVLYICTVLLRSESLNHIGPLEWAQLRPVVVWPSRVNVSRVPLLCVRFASQCTSGTIACGTRRAACTGLTCAAQTRWTSTRAARRARRSGKS